MKVKKVLKSLFGGQSKSTSYKVYQSIDELPIYNWFKIFETNNFEFLVISGNPSQKVLSDFWELIFNEYIQQFGLNESFKNHFEQTKKILDLRVKIALEEKENKKKQLLFKLKVEADKFDALNPTKQESDNYMTTIVAIENYLNRSINEREMTVKKFYTYLKNLENEQATR